MSDTMQSGAGVLRVAVVTPEGSVFDGEARCVVVPGDGGEVAFWPLHAAYVGALGEGELRITRPGGEVQRWVLEGGVAEVAGSRVTVLADRVAPLASIDVAATRASLAKALATVPADDAGNALRDAAIRRAQVRLYLATRGAEGAPH
ncbi:MAG: ATP synthase F1 subunit epsilon [Planctomycetia bacterium]